MFSNIINMKKYLEMLPEHIVNKIILYNSHPVADLFKKSKTYQSFYTNFPNGEIRYHDDGEEFIHEPCFVEHWAMLHERKHDKDYDDKTHASYDRMCAEYESDLEDIDDDRMYAEYESDSEDDDDESIIDFSSQRIKQNMRVRLLG